MWFCVCVYMCVCVCMRERDKRETDDRDRLPDSETVRYKVKEKKKYNNKKEMCVCVCVCVLVSVFASTLMNVTPGGLHPWFSNPCNLTPPSVVNQPPWRTARQSEQPPRGLTLTTTAHTHPLIHTQTQCVPPLS